MKKKRKGVKNTAPKCPYCGSHTIFRSAEGIYHKNPEREMLYVCKNYPTCDAYVRVHRGTRIPMGVPANWKLRRLRNEAHHYFDQLYKSGYMSRQDAYHWLADILCVPYSQAHIGYLGEYYCQKVIEESKKMLSNCPAGRKTSRKNNKRGGKRHGADTEAATHR